MKSLLLSSENLSITYFNDAKDPERNLFAEIISRAIRDAVNPTEERHFRREAIDWLCLKKEIDGENTPFSFWWLCKALDLSPHEVKRAILVYVKTGELFPC